MELIWMIRVFGEGDWHGRTVCAWYEGHVGGRRALNSVDERSKMFACWLLLPSVSRCITAACASHHQEAGYNNDVTSATSNY
jgi:hypothetical protein